MVMTTENKRKLLILVDGSSYLHRAYHALPSLANSQGEPTGAVYGVVSMVKKIISEYQPDYVGVVFDAKGKNFRHELYPAYKATRPPMADDLKAQIQPLYEIIEAMGVPLLVIDGVEADDVIGTLVQKSRQDNIDVLISTGDKDLAQLAQPNVTLINTMTDIKMDVDGVKDKFGVKPEQIIDYLTLVGDISDNVLGVPGVGPKTATKWLEEYGTLENIIKHRDNIKGKVGENLRATLDRLALIQELVTIKNNLPLNIELNGLVPRGVKKEKLIDLFTRLEFKSWLVDLVGTEKNIKQDSKYQIILAENDFELWLKKLQAAHAFAFDTETTSLDVMNAELVGISFAVEEGEAIYIPLAHTYEGVPKQLERDYVLQKLRPLFVDHKKIKFGQNLKYDIGILANYGIEVHGICYDTMLESYVLNSSNSQHDKGSLAFRYLGKSIASYEDIVGKGAKQIPFDQVKIETAAPYAAFDADLVLQLHRVFWDLFEKSPGQKRILQEIEMPLLKVLAHMEHRGVFVDEKILKQFGLEFGRRLEILEYQIYHDAKAEFNINSPSQLQEILFKKLQLPILQKTPTGQPSTAEGVLQELALDYELPQLILEYRSLNKLKSTYTDALPAQINSRTRRIHTSYNQAVTTTGRLSSTNPNLQNIPVRTEEGRKIRRAFIAPSGYKIVSADYSQIELRIMAHLSQDENLILAFREGYDIHRMVAAEIFSVRPEDVTDNMRRNAKTINFGLIYGMSPFGLAKRIGMTREEAGKYIELYFSRYPKMSEYMEKMKKNAHGQGFVESIYGRRIYVNDIRSKNFSRRQAAERIAINAPIQASAADIIKMAMINIDQWLNSSDLKAAMIMQVHDELVFEVAENFVDSFLPKIKKQMEEVVNLNVPIVVGVGVGDNWDEAH